jgi:hypothetical protein
MNRIARFLLIGLVALQPAAASGERASEPAETAEMKALSQRLGDIISRALDAEVLDAPGTHDLGGGEVQSPVECTRENPLDFSAFSKQASFADLQAALTVKAELKGEDPARAGQRLAKAYLAAGLTAEARAALAGNQHGESQALRLLADFLDGGPKDSLEALRDLAFCHEETQIWLGAALVANDAPEGALLLTGQFGEIRELPLQLRADFTARAMPGLLRQGEKELAMKLLAAFGEEEVQASARLRFCSTLMELGQPKPDARKELAYLLHSARFQADALSALMVQTTDWSRAQRLVLTEDVARMIPRHRSESELFRFLQFMLGEEDEEINYSALARRIQSALPSPSARMVATHLLGERLKSDLQQQSPILALSAMQFLKDEPALLKDHPDYAGLYVIAMHAASALGYDQLSLSLSEGAGDKEMQGNIRASVDFRRKDYKSVLSVAAAYPKQEAIQLLAARAAVRIGEPAQMQDALKRISLTPAIARQLIQEDVIAGHWIAPQSLYDLAGKDADAAAVERLAQIGKIRAGREAAKARLDSLPVVPASASRAGQEMHE